MRKLLAINIFCFIAVTLKAQFYGNGWINYSQKYFKFPIHKEGIYRIDSTTLAAHFNLSTLNPKNIQLFIRGKEQNIYIRGEEDGQINKNDYIEFYANTNTSDLDSSIYNKVKYVPNPYIPLFSDTVYAFLTVNTSLSNKRFVLETDTNSAAYTAEDHFYTERVFTDKSGYNTVTEYYYDVTDPRYTQQECYGIPFSKGNSVSTNFSGLNPYTASPLPCFLRLNFSGSSQDFSFGTDHDIRTSFTDQSGGTVILKDTSFFGFTSARQSFSISSQNIGNNSNFKIESLPTPSLASIDNSTFLNFIRFFYPQTLNLNNQSVYKLVVGNSVSAKGFYNLSGFNFNGNDSVHCYDLTNGKKIRAVKANAMVRLVIPNGTGQKMCYLASGSQIINITSLRPVNQTGSFNNFKNPSFTKPFVIIYHRDTKTGALQYQNYRQTPAGGSYNVIAAESEELCDQFAYGYYKHPVSIRNFVHFLKDSLPVPPKYLFLIGKSVGSDALSTGSQKENLVPSLGVPSSDNLLTASLSGTNTIAPEIPVGRISALNNAEVSAYLAKVQQHESSPPAEWKKKVLHFIGGNEINLTNTLSGLMSSYEQTIRDTLFGGVVSTFKKNTTAPIQITISDSIKSTISNGAALLNFFGHGSEQGFDQAIDDPEQYNNTGKYPFVIANSCYSGNIHIFGRRSVSEKFIFANQKGSIGFLAATSTGFVHALNTYNVYFYNALSKTRYHQGIGDVIKEAAEYTSLTGDSITRFTAADMTLHGDPSLRISNGLLPDYQIKNSSISFDLKKHTDSIGVKINITNLGAAVHDSIFVKVQRYYANGDSAIIFKRKLGTYFKDSVVFFHPIDFNRGVGLNKFRVKVDEFNEVTESIETNNATIGTVDVFIPGGDILPAYPYKYAIVPKTNTITLKASTTNPFAPQNTYRFQLDTCDKFSQPLQTALITSKGGVIEWTVNLPLKDSTVYFWRVSRDSTSPSNGFIWKESSFQTVGTKRGWAQAHFHQFKSDAYQFVSYKKPQRKFIFENNKHSIGCRNAIYPAIFPTNINFFFNNINMSSWGCGPNGWNFAVFDSISGEPQQVFTDNVPGPEPGPYNNCMCVDGQVLHVYSFGANNYCGISTWKTDVENFLNAVPVNNYVLAYTMGEVAPGNAQITTYNNSLYTAFESIGAATIRNVKDTVPYILFGRKGMVAGQGHEEVGTGKNEVIMLTDSIKTRWNSGYIASEIVGPSFKWNSLHWRVKSEDMSPGDTTILKLVGITQSGQMDTLVTFPKDSADVLSLGAYANASVYPYLKMVAFMKDNVHRTSPQLKRWQLIYDEAPECAINPLKGFASINDTLQEGDVVTFRFPIENIGVKNFEDSLVITYWIEDNNRNKVPVQQSLKAKPFVPSQVIIDTVKINSYQLAGSNSLWIFANPLGNAKYQREQHQFNNLGSYSFKVNRDVTNPLLDVTFDGIRILNGDIVSAKPNILITLKDENKFLELNDTAAFYVFLQAPGHTQQRIYFAQGLQFTPASLPKNSCSINYNPVLTVDGKYTLMVQARDRSMNRSGIQSYQVDFEVNNKPTVTSVMNYPNPFTTSTRFVFTLTGSEIPEVFTIQIMTISGKVVKEITRSELGSLHIGRNITEYTWDGRDNFGDRLGNGVYLYKVITKLNGEYVEKSATEADKFFTKEFGKMVIMR